MTPLPLRHKIKNWVSGLNCVVISFCCMSTLHRTYVMIVQCSFALKITMDEMFWLQWKADETWIGNVCFFLSQYICLHFGHVYLTLNFEHCAVLLSFLLATFILSKDNISDRIDIWSVLTQDYRKMKNICNKMKIPHTIHCIHFRLCHVFVVGYEVQCSEICGRV